MKMPSQSTRSWSPNAAVRCPHCSAAPGELCRNRRGEALDGDHIERRGEKRAAIRAALDFYAGMGLRTKPQIKRRA